MGFLMKPESNVPSSHLFSKAALRLQKAARTEGVLLYEKAGNYTNESKMNTGDEHNPNSTS